MSETVRAVYEKGMLRPLRPLHLRERQTVQLQIVVEEPAESENEAEAAIRLLVAAGQLTPPPRHPDIAPISEQARHELADRLGHAPGKPLSEIIIEDRGER
jgi:predicted DNA-binding antitoxin AbrB/MazE fold protein